MTESITGDAVVLETDKPVGEPGDGVRLAAAGGVLDEVSPSDARFGHIGEQLAYDFELVVAGPDLLPLDSRGVPVLRLDDLGVVLDDVGEAVAGEHPLPQVVGLESVRVRWIPGTVVPAAVEWEEPRGLAFKFGAEAHLVVVYREMDEAASELKELLARVAVALVLLDRVLDRLLGEAVLELEGGDRQSVDEKAQVEGKLDVAAAVPELSSHAEAVQRVEVFRLLVIRGRRAVEEVESVRTVSDAVAEHVYGSALAYLTPEAREEVAPCRAVVVETEGGGDIGLGCAEEGGKLREVDAELAVVVGGIAAEPAGAIAGRAFVHAVLLRRLARAACEGCADEGLEASFGGVGGHAWLVASQPLSLRTWSARRIWRSENWRFHVFHP